MRSLIKHDDAFTGLEAAIVLIAFIVVAAVFSYVVLGAGFFTTQKSQEVVHTGVQQASSSMEVIGNVYGVATTASENLAYVQFTVGNTAGGTALDVSKMVVSYLDGETRSADVEFVDDEDGDTLKETLKSASASMDGTAGNMGKWGIIEKVNANDNDVLEPGEQFVIGVSTPTTLTANTPFSVNLQPSVGAVFALQKTLPPALHRVNILY
ncbi:archaellin/type IV pilin N-terminal domain-containing protein [Methanoculleus sp.]|uniref:archaellin/type IV pilin N-terminal domain-containing protein n=1 Tax=Methanoculleus sp. TaxID=90427 RepID=UPI0025EB3BEC|nr:archaellin/type IV pilin N-terminal domain-containing protein [Methanoculleus sp.]